MKKPWPTRLLSLLLAAVLLLGLTAPASAAGSKPGPTTSSLQFEQVDNSEISAGNLLEEAEAPETQSTHADTDIVRVSIVLKEKSTLEAGYSTQAIAENSAAMAYRARLEQRQSAVIASIEQTTGSKLDVAWNLTLAANIISANVAYGDIPTLEAVPGVKEVVLETRYEPAVVNTDEAADPNMSTSPEMIGSGLAWSAGYTGAGMRIAIIDTGIDTDHQSFSAEGYEHSLAVNAEQKGMTAQAYTDSLNLLNAVEIAEKLPQLNISNFTADELYVSSKIPFGFNYIDLGLDITHDHDSASEHGSHVSGISAANAYIPDGNGGFSKALTSVMVQGVAPDAQIITMKVFGKSGGAFDSDYMAAIEDAIVLGADSINLSLGSASPGFTRSAKYQDVMDRLTESDTVVTISMGNSYSWPEKAFHGTGYLYANDVSLHTGGAPGSYANALTVASVDNIGRTGLYIQAGEDIMLYNEPDFTNEPLVTLAGEQNYVLIDGTGTAEEFAALADTLKGKIAVCSRGGNSFAEKANNAVANGAIAAIIYNNQAGTFNMDLTDYSYTNPCISITQADGALLKANAKAVTDTDGEVLCYTGTLTISKEITSHVTEQEYYNMSIFSSWGVPGSLILKPEITAPGGSIYSVNGQIPGGQAYENMSGTSMAAPQVAGMAALVMQYIQENNLEEKTGLSGRVLAQSLLMSTAQPLLESAGRYWSILKQGAGLGNVNSAVTADSYLMMDDNATDSAADGKIKVELGDDPDRKGEYSFSFTLNNLTDSEKRYTLSSSFFTQDLLTKEGLTYLDTRTTALPADVTYLVDGRSFVPTTPLVCDLDGDGDTDAADAQIILNYAAGLTDTLDDIADLDGDGAFTTYDAYVLLDSLSPDRIAVPANGSVRITVTAVLPETVKAYLDSKYENGAYVEGYVSVIPTSTEEGEAAPAHSIPVLGFYGNWSDPSMFDQLSAEQYAYGTDILPYTSHMRSNNLVVRRQGSDINVYYLTNPYIMETSYPTERRAINSGAMLYAYYVSMIRNAAASALVVLDENGKIMELTDMTTDKVAAYLHVNASSWQNTLDTISYSRLVSSLGLQEDDVFTIAYVAVPEYYFPKTGATEAALRELIESGKLGKGAFLSTTMTVDNTAPVITGISKDLMEDRLTVTATDNQYIAAVQIFDNNGMDVLATSLMEQDEAGKGGSVTFDLSGVKIGSRCLVRVADYAGNEATYRVNYGGEDEDYTGRMYGFMSTGTFNYRGTGRRWIEVFPDTLYYYSGNYGGSKTVAPYDVRVMAADYVGGYVYMYATNGYLYVAPQGDWTNYRSLQYIGTSPAVRDMAFNYADGKLYAMMDNNLVCSIDLITGELTEEFRMTITNPKTKNADYLTLQGLAIDDEGTFYSINQTTRTYAYLYKWTRDDVVDGKITDLAPVINTKTGTIGTYDFRLKACLAWDHDKDILYVSANSQLAENVGSSNELLAIMNTTTGKASLATNYDGGTGGTYAPSRFYSAVSGLYIVPSKSVTVVPSDQVSKITLDAQSLALIPGSSRTLAAEVFPWTLSDRSAQWSTSDPAVATVQDGVVTGVAPGTAVIRAAATADPSVYLECTVTVTELQDITLNALVTDASGASYWSEFHTSDFRWTKLSGEAEDYVAGGCLTYDQRLIVHKDGNVYSVDPDSFAVTDLGGIHENWMWTDAAEAPDQGNGRFGYLTGITYGGKNFSMVNPVDGRVGYWSLYNTFAMDPMAAVAYSGKEEFAGAEALRFYVITEGGQLYKLLTFYSGSSATPTISYSKVCDTDIRLPGAALLESGKRASMHYDEATGHMILTYSQPGSQVQVYAVDPFNASTAHLGQFDESVSSVVSLYQYEQVKELTVRLRPDSASIYEDETVACEAHVLPVSYEDKIIWTSSDPTVATVDENGLVSGVSAGTVTITATSAATDANGQAASASLEIEVKALAHINTAIHGQITTEDGVQWVTIDAADLSNITVEGSARRQLTAGGAHNGKIYGIVSNYTSTAPFYVVDPANGFAERTGSGCVYGYAPLDVTTAPADTTTVTTSDNVKVDMDTFDVPVYIAWNKYLIMLKDVDEGQISGWDTLKITDAAAITYKGVGVFSMAGNAKTQDFIILGANGNLYLAQIWPNYNKKTGVLGYSMTRSTIGNCGISFADETKLSMTYVDDGVNKGVIIAYSDDAATLFYVDLTGKKPVGIKMGSIPGATAISSLYTDRDLALDAQTADNITVDDGCIPFSSWTTMGDDIPEITADIALDPTQLEVSKDAGSTQALRNAETGIRPAAAKETVQRKDRDLVLTLSEDQTATNGLIRVSYDPSILTFAGADTLLPNHAVNGETAGTVIFDYASAQAIAAGTSLAQLRFTFTGEPKSTQLRIEVLERNQELKLHESTDIAVEVPCDGKDDCPTAKFEDLSVDSWYHESTDFVLKNGLMYGVSATRFDPNTAATRAQLVAVLYRMEGKPAVEGKQPFADVADSQYYADAVKWASANGIVYGVDETHFAPNQAVTREQMVAILYRYAAYKGVDTTGSADLSGFTDAAKISSYARAAMAWAVETGLIAGVGNGKLDPQGAAVRVQIAAVLTRCCKRFA